MTTIAISRDLLKRIDRALRDELDQAEYERVGLEVEALTRSVHQGGDPVAVEFEREQEIRRRAREIGPTLGGESTVDRLRAAYEDEPRP
jgi:hypothetical protein